MKNKTRNLRVAAKARRELAYAPGRNGSIPAITPEKLGELKKRLSNSRSPSLVEANEQLVFAMLRTQVKAERAELKLQEALRSAETDALTGLPNRVLFFDRFTRAITNAKRHNERLALLFLDLNNFNQINDTLGHSVGDEVLKHAAHCFVSTVREADTVCRLGGDEFLILLTEISQPADAALIAKKLSSALGAPSRVGEHVLRLTTSIGICIYPDDGDNPNLLVERADAAMYRAKRHGLGGFVFHGDESSSEQRQVPQTLESLKRLVTHYELLQAKHNHQLAHLQEANEQLIFSALTAQSLQAAAEQAERQQKDALPLLAHELRTALSPIRMVAEMLGRNSPHVPPRLLEVFARQVTHLTRILDDLLHISRAGTAKLKLQRQIVDLGEVISAVVQAWRPEMLSRSQQFSLNMPAQAVQINADPVRLEQILDNLLGNACQYTPRGGQIKLGVKMEGDSVILTFADSGIGISAETLPSIFEPFTQDAHAVGCSEGLGIGLTVVRELVLAHGGEVSASSPGIGRGAQFVVKLPCAGQPRAA